MNNNRNQMNYHSALEHLSSDIDPVLKKLQMSNRRIDVEEEVWTTLLLAPLREMKNLPKVFQDISNFNVSAIPLIGTLLSGVVSYLLADWSLTIDGLVSLGIFLLLYLALLPKYFYRMINFHDSLFHLKAFKKFRQQEYDLISYAVENDLSYRGLYDFVTGVLTKQDNTSKTIEIVTEQYNKEKQNLKDMHKERLKEVIEQVDELSEYVMEYKEEARVLDTYLKYLIELLTDINTILFRMVNGVFKISDLKFLSGFTVYQKEGKELVKIYDEGTTGSSPHKLHLENKKFQNWTAVMVAKEELKYPKIDSPRENYNVISYRMELGKPKNDVWIFNFHINRETNRKAWYLLRDNDIISKEVIYRLFHALSLILYEQLGGVVSGTSTRRTKEGTEHS